MKPIIAISMMLALLLGAAQAEYYTANEDLYYHARPDCTENSDFSISEKAAWHFRKVACPSCVNRTANEGEIIDLPVPEDFRLYAAEMDDQGRLILAGYAGIPMKKSSYISLFTREGHPIRMQQDEGDELFYRDADILADGSIATLKPCSQDPGDDHWKIQLAEDGGSFRDLLSLEGVFKLESAQDGILVGSHPDTASYLLAKYDRSGKLLWQTREPGHMCLSLLSNEGLHLGYGRRAVDAADYQGAQDAFALIFDDEGSILARIVDQSAREFRCGAWCADGSVLLSGISDSMEFIAKYSAAGERIWRRELQYIRGDDNTIQIEGNAVRVLAIQDILPRKNGHLLAISTDDDYIRVVEINTEGYIARDWVEFIGDFASIDALQIFNQQDGVYLLTGGLTLDELEAYEADMSIAEIPRKYTLKAISAAEE